MTEAKTAYKALDVAAKMYLGMMLSAPLGLRQHYAVAMDAGLSVLKVPPNVEQRALVLLNRAIQLDLTGKGAPTAPPSRTQERITAKRGRRIRVGPYGEDVGIASKVGGLLKWPLTLGATTAITAVALDSLLGTGALPSQIMQYVGYFLAVPGLANSTVHKLLNEYKEDTPTGQFLRSAFVITSVAGIAQTFDAVSNTGATIAQEAIRSTSTLGQMGEITAFLGPAAVALLFGGPIGAASVATLSTGFRAYMNSAVETTVASAGYLPTQIIGKISDSWQDKPKVVADLMSYFQLGAGMTEKLAGASAFLRGQAAILEWFAVTRNLLTLNLMLVVMTGGVLPMATAILGQGQEVGKQVEQAVQRKLAEVYKPIRNTGAYVSSYMGSLFRLANKYKVPIAKIVSGVAATSVFLGSRITQPTPTIGSYLFGQERKQRRTRKPSHYNTMISREFAKYKTAPKSREEQRLRFAKAVKAVQAKREVKGKQKKN